MGEGDFLNFKGVSFEFSVDTVMLMVVFNIILTGLHWWLQVLHDKKKAAWSDGPLTAVTFMMSMVSIVLGNMKHREPSKELKG